MQIMEDEGISQRATAKMIGVSNETIRQDVNKLTDNGNNTIEYEEDTENIVNKLTPTGAELVKKEQKKVDKEIKKQEDKKEEEKKKEDAGKIDAAIVVNNNYNKCLRTQ
jgi:predicted transcriptional regulator